MHYNIDELRRQFHNMLGLLRKIILVTHDSPKIKPHLSGCIQSVEEMLKLLSEERREGDSPTSALSASLESVTETDHHISFLNKVRKFIDDHMQEPNLDISLLARGMHMSTSNLYRRIRASSGMSTIDFLIDYKMKYAARLLLSAPYSIKEVSSMIGFNDARYFSTCFKRHFRQTPTAYRRQVTSKISIL